MTLACLVMCRRATRPCFLSPEVDENRMMISRISLACQSFVRLRQMNRMHVPAVDGVALYIERWTSLRWQSASEISVVSSCISGVGR